MPEIGIADKSTLDLIKSLIGKSDDLVGANTVFSKLSQAISTGSRKAHTGSFTTTSSTLQTALSVSGSGVLTGLHCYDSSGYTGRIVITIDGVVLLDQVISSRGGGLGVRDNGLSIPTDNAAPVVVHIEFKSSLLVQISANGANPRNVGWLYNM